MCQLLGVVTQPGRLIRVEEFRRESKLPDSSVEGLAGAGTCWSGFAPLVSNVIFVF